MKRARSALGRLAAGAILCAGLAFGGSAFAQVAIGAPKGAK